MNRRAAAGFTLLELMLATVLTVVLMMGVMMVITTLRTSPALAGPNVEATDAQQGDPGAIASHAASVERWIDLLRRDLRHADTIDATGGNTVLLVGPLGLDAAGRAMTHRPVEVTYRLTERDGRTWLFREQAALDLPSNRHRQRDLVLTGITAFTLESRVLPAPAEEADQPAMLARAVGRTRPAADAGASHPVGSSTESEGPTNEDAPARQFLPTINGRVDLPEDHNEQPEGPQRIIGGTAGRARDRGASDARGTSDDRDAADASDDDEAGTEEKDERGEAAPAPAEARSRVAWSLRWTDMASDAPGESERERMLLIRMEQAP